MSQPVILGRTSRSVVEAENHDLLPLRLEHLIDELGTFDSNGEDVQRDVMALAAPPKPGVLVVDDEHMVRIMVQLGLELYGFDVLVASTGREAVELYTAHRKRIAVVLLDVQMQELDGTQTFDALRKVDPAVPVCFMSGDAGNYQRDDLDRCGAACIINKPFDLHELSYILRLVANGLPVNLPKVR
jgi:CheY-like chemotaxis protein